MNANLAQRTFFRPARGIPRDGLCETRRKGGIEPR